MIVTLDKQQRDQARAEARRPDRALDHVGAVLAVGMAINRDERQMRNVEVYLAPEIVPDLLADDAYAFLVQGEFPHYEVHGYISGREAKQLGVVTLTDLHLIRADREQDKAIIRDWDGSWKQASYRMNEEPERPKRSDRCIDCDEFVEPQEAWFEVKGFERKRLQGGTNHVALREPTGRVLCQGCLRKQQRGIAPGQEALL